ncbi:MAG: hypothetical protein KJ072_19000, partial [Verrucomicrobia bacterium]|nr:hypothetical protein [Verrucomicrobiota bacterium]
GASDSWTDFKGKEPPLHTSNLSPCIELCPTLRISNLSPCFELCPSLLILSRSLCFPWLWKWNSRFS